MANNDFLLQELTESLHKHGCAIEKAVHSGDEIKIAETLKGISKNTLEQLVKHNMGYHGKEHGSIKHLKKELANRSNAKKIRKESVEINELSKELMKRYLNKAQWNKQQQINKHKLDIVNDTQKKTRRSDREKRITRQIIKMREKGISMATKRVIG